MTPSSASRAAVRAPDAPAAVGPYSQAVSHGGLLFCSGQLPLDPGDGERVAGSAGAQATQCLENLAAICRAAGTELTHALRVTVYTTCLEAFAEINEAYSAFFGSVPPGRVAVGVAALPKGAAVEIDAIIAMT